MGPSVLDAQEAELLQQLAKIRAQRLHMLSAQAILGDTNFATAGCGWTTIRLHPQPPQRFTPRSVVRTETRRQKRRDSKHRKRRNRRDEDEIRALGSDNVNIRAIAARLHGQMIYNNNII